MQCNPHTTWSRPNSTTCARNARRSKQGGGAERIAKQHNSGKLTARERITKLVDEGSFQEIGLFAQHRATLFGMAGKEMPADGVVTGCATIDGRLVHLASQDFTVAGRRGGRGPLPQGRRHDAAVPEDRQPVRLHQRLRRRARAGGHRLPGRLRRRSSTPTSCSPAPCRRSR